MHQLVETPVPAFRPEPAQGGRGRRRIHDRLSGNPPGSPGKSQEVEGAKVKQQYQAGHPAPAGKDRAFNFQGPQAPDQDSSKSRLEEGSQPFPACGPAGRFRIAGKGLDVHAGPEEEVAESPSQADHSAPGPGQPQGQPFTGDKKNYGEAPHKYPGLGKVLFQANHQCRKNS